MKSFSLLFILQCDMICDLVHSTLYKNTDVEKEIKFKRKIKKTLCSLQLYALTTVWALRRDKSLLLLQNRKKIRCTICTI